MIALEPRDHAFPLCLTTVGAILSAEGSSTETPPLEPAVGVTSAETGAVKSNIPAVVESPLQLFTMSLAPLGGAEALPVLPTLTAPVCAFVGPRGAACAAEPLPTPP